MCRSRWSKMRMWSCVTLVVVAALVGTSSGKVYTKCELAKELTNTYHLSRTLVKNFVCIAQYESGFNTAATNKNTNGSKDYGIFQINDMYWCIGGIKSSSNYCKLQCSNLLNSNIGDDVDCAQTIYKRQGFKAWYAWRAHCEKQDLDKYIAGCF
ncbi:lysozyme c-1 [Procambarus clarkii]|uniref:lysozyme c-1 n=1 Tax=Procambarus clarkii TaxID=6728 RepID=UPI001E678352|nr:lysozyme c-1-like [Procambarus clarkii]